MKTPEEHIKENIEISDSLIYEIQQSNIMARNKMVPTDLKIKLMREMLSNIDDLSAKFRNNIINYEYIQIEERTNS